MSEVGAVCFNVLSLGRLSVCNLQIGHTIGFLCFHFSFSCSNKTVSFSVYKSRNRDLTFVRTVYLSPMWVVDCWLCQVTAIQLVHDFAQQSLLLPCWHTGLCSSVKRTCSSNFSGHLPFVWLEQLLTHKLVMYLLSSLCRTPRLLFTYTALVPTVAAIQALLLFLQLFVWHFNLELRWCKSDLRITMSSPISVWACM